MCVPSLFLSAWLPDSIASGYSSPDPLSQCLRSVPILLRVFLTSVRSSTPISDSSCPCTPRSRAEIAIRGRAGIHRARLNTGLPTWALRVCELGIPLLPSVSQDLLTLSVQIAGALDLSPTPLP
ncbi:hypothetical protein NMY22_g17563 [Coprinellus aureogranulatus]|nr:hypothetical protein NMY22_g17563 [Coprinellus aureogranulatus]